MRTGCGCAWKPHRRRRHTFIRCSASRSPAAAPASIPRSISCARRVRRRAPCSSPPPPKPGRSSHGPAAPRAAMSCMRPPPEGSRSGNSRQRRQPSRRLPRPGSRVPTDFTLIGRPVHRIDGRAKVTGQARFGIDVKVPGMLTAVIARPPVFGGTVRHFNADKAKAIPGVKQVVQIDTGIAVLADGFWPARQGRDALDITWDDGPLATSRQRDTAQAVRRAGAARRLGGGSGRHTRRHSRGLCQGAEEARGRLRSAVPRARGHGAAQLRCARAARMASRSGSERRCRPPIRQRRRRSPA